MDAPEGPKQPNHMRRSTKYLWATGGAGLTATLALVAQMNGLYTTKSEGANLKESIARVEEASLKQMNANKQDLMLSINGGFARIETLIEKSLRNQAEVNARQERENRDFAIQIENLKFVLGLTTKKTKTN